jgi:hypothetical protein
MKLADISGTKIRNIRELKLMNLELTVRLALVNVVMDLQAP